MKNILVLMIAMASYFPIKAQLANTSWKGKFNLPDPTEMILQFKTDTLLLNDTNGSTFESMSYKISNDTLSILKLGGQSDCSYSEYATYLVEIKGKKLIIKPLNDNCYDRETSWTEDGLEKIEPGT